MIIKDKGTPIRKELGAILLLAITLTFGLFMSGEAGEYVKEGLGIAVNCVIPTSFPFMIISDIYVCYGNPENIRILKKCTQVIFGFSPHSLAPFICGNIGGFPIGAKMVADCYASGMIEKDEAEHLLPLCNNPSCAFIVGGVGLGIFGEIRIGFLLLISLYSAILLCGLITRKSYTKFNLSVVNTRQTYSFTTSVKNAGISCIGIISFISIFSAINGIIKKRIKYAPLLYVISAFSEVTNAIKILSSASDIPRTLALSLTAFSLGFGGICVAFQSTVFTTSCGIGMKRYYLTKLLEGVLAASVFSILFIIIK